MYLLLEVLCNKLSFIHCLIHLFNKHLLITYNEQAILLDMG